MLGDPDWGCYLIDRVFEYNGIYVEALVREDIAEAVRKYEPRINMSENDITIVHEDNVIRIFIEYEIKETGEINMYNMDITNEDNPYKI